MGVSQTRSFRFENTCSWGLEPQVGAGWQARASPSSGRKRADEEKNANVFLFSPFPGDPSMLGGQESLREAGVALGQERTAPYRVPGSSQP